MRPGLVSFVVAFFCVLTSAPASANDFYAYELDGKTWISNYCPPKAKKCKRIMKSWSGDTAGKAPAAAGKTAPAGNRKASTFKRRTKSWKPPRLVQFDDKKSVDTKNLAIEEIVGEASRTYNIPEAFIHAVITVESSYKTRALSYKGAMGLMQLMPGTAADLGVKDPYDPYQNVMGATRFLRMLANRFDGDLPKVLAAFHAGGSAVAKADGIPFQGSDGYVRKVLKNYYKLKPQYLQSARNVE